jgi:hypothetical protein
MYSQSLLILKVEETEGLMVVVLALPYARGSLTLQLLSCSSFWKLCSGVVFGDSWLSPTQHIHLFIYLFIYLFYALPVHGSLVLTWSSILIRTHQHLCKILRRFVSLMGGHIWIDSEGTGRGCTARFVIKLGVCDNTNTYQQQLVPLVWPSSADSNLSAPKVLPDGRGSVSLKSRYQRSVWAQCKWLTA